jgi:hypothetical protein
MKISASLNLSGLAIPLAELCAKAIFDAKIRQHLVLLRKASLAPDHPVYMAPVYEQADYRDAQALIRGIEDAHERRAFGWYVKSCLKELWGSRHVRGRDYVESVRKHEAGRLAVAA